MSLRLKTWDQVLHDKDHGWNPLLALVYLVFFLATPLFDHATPKQWFFDILGVIIFLALYLGLFFLENTRPILHIVGMVFLGMLFMPFNGGACTFFIYAGAISPFVMPSQRAGIWALASISVTAAAEGLILKQNGGVLFFSAVFPLFVGASNLFIAERQRMNCKLRKANEEIEHLAKLAERERIARDLHDVLGHTLSVITLKSELAGKLLNRDPERSGKEIREVEEISRKALSEVRDAIRGYRAEGLAAELAHAKATLETAGVAVQCDASTRLQLPAMQESVLSLAVREGVTNVVRHAQARNCRLHLEQHNGSCRLEIADDGQGFVTLEGNGLRGMRERVEMLGGTLERTNRSGTTLVITLPLKAVSVRNEGSQN